jgi:hypothetical protein
MDLGERATGDINCSLENRHMRCFVKERNIDKLVKTTRMEES